MTGERRVGISNSVDSSIIPGTLRAQLEEAAVSGMRADVQQTVAILVSLCVELGQRHDNGQSLFVHPSSVVVDVNGNYMMSEELAIHAPSLPKDQACMAPEERSGEPGNARASVFAIGAMMYELLTGETVGPGMRRPRELVPEIPEDLESVLAKALVADPAHRPADLRALAQAIHGLAPRGSVPAPPPASGDLDHGSDFDVDISMSMLPPEPSTPYNIRVKNIQVQVSGDAATNELTALKARLESDPRPRYVVKKDGMDHGPFNAVELLMQIGSNTFVEEDILHDSFSQLERSIADWNEFAPFAEHARRNRVIVAEKVAVEQVVANESKSTRGKALGGVAIVGAILALGGTWLFTQVGSRNDDVKVQGETVTSVEMEGELKGGKKKAGGGRRILGSRGGIPQLAGGISCEAAINAYNEEITIGGGKGKADLTRAQYGAVLNSGSYFGHCGAPSSMSINICAAVQNGRAVGVTVTTKPRNAGVSRCISGSVRKLSFPSHPKLDVTRTGFAAQ